MENQLKSNWTDCMRDWDWEENARLGLSPEQIGPGSRERVAWKCHACGGKWNTVAKERRGCPYCTGFKALRGFNDLATTHPQLAEEWDVERNGALYPWNVTSGSQRKVYWKCDKGHSWIAQINSRVAGRGCPYCSNRRVLAGFNDLATLNPSLAREWHPTKNGALTPKDVLAGTKKRAWWRCAQGHEWAAAVSYRNRGTGCPVCASKTIVRGYNDLASAFPSLAREWDRGRNEKGPEEYACSSRAKVWWICERGHRWQAVIGDRSRGNGCPKCSEERQTSFPEKAILYYLKKHFDGIEANYRSPWLGLFELDIYLPQYRIGIEYDGSYGHAQEAGRKRDIRKNDVCAKNGVTLLRIRESGCPELGEGSMNFELIGANALPEALCFLTDKIEQLTGVRCGFRPDEVCLDRDAGEIYSLMEHMERENSVLVRAPQIAALWHPSKNGNLRPEHVSVGTPRKVWWLGACGHEWRSAVIYEVASGKCPYCTGKRVLPGFNDLSTVNPTLAAEWNAEKNAPLAPAEITPGSGRKVWWRCAAGHSWRASVVSRNRGNGCPICANRIVLKGFNDVASAPELLQDWDAERNGDCAPDAICVGSGKRMWWICHRCGFQWAVPVAARASGSGCPKCAGILRWKHIRKNLAEAKGSLMQECPSLMREWDWERNESINPEQITAGCTKKAWWTCSVCGNQWEASIASRSAGRGCPRCGKARQAAARQKTLLKRKPPLSQTHPDLAGEWDAEKNGGLSPEMVTAGSGKRVWWRCRACGFEWNACIAERSRDRASCARCRERHKVHQR